MDEGTFDEKFAHSILLESLKEALKQMIDEFYVEKEIGLKIYKEACANVRKEILENSSQLSDVHISGQMKSYYCRNDVWTFFFKNSLFKIIKNKKAKNSSKENKNYHPLNLKVFKNFYDKREEFLKYSIDNNNVKIIKNFGKLYCQIVHKEEGENEADDAVLYYDGLIKVLCVEDAL
ncbi:conserved Plasmodium protein, unknown function [Plasmodium vivax]|uniref:Transcription initiation factor IIA subunit 2 n=6 Tax=Plasmodium vivax TaxID=5855 RepID=A5K910_PLAVS|nr:hypothetical protein, conserved [Plasmodium vivax]KMZ77591.1 hypothetical protein PVIIG_01560 [Plasmodium vivax India VII]KMZ84751.1 hypothetical protein PVBG_00531 [Plasmodium vivax Brazil I]KMZ90030.1 hypothetical protein PVMG_03591 [Plasmodium vivax Mauritania I]KMZ96586.1 hypothetical protein PVNG_01983 [Plasmodium vivax North Korean]EDL44306.1 hypothetical protein, conserved [Plasmodium vivax]|eukprot:XP_001614033.1 hypothetical protein [Plasmodium vivax Sal-1]